jgi:heme/copper-type cytochrome/quinol oxidase subunit 3
VNVAIAAAIPSTVLLLSPQAVDSSFLSLATRTTIFLLFQTVVYIGLSSHMFVLPYTNVLKYPANVVRSLSLNSTILWTVVLMVSGLSSTVVDISTLGLVLARTLEWMAVISVVSANFHYGPVYAYSNLESHRITDECDNNVDYRR